MTTLTKRNWYARKVNRPYKDDDNYYLNVYSPIIERGLADPENAASASEYVDSELQTSALNSILSYYGKRQTSAEYRASLDPVPPPLTLQIKNIYFPKRALVNPIVLLALPKEQMENPELIRDLAPPEINQSEVAPGGLENIQVDQIKPFLAHIDTAFKIYQQQLQYFNGSITPRINFLGLSSKVKAFFDNLENFISFNGYDLKKYQTVNLGFNEDFKVVYVRLNLKPGSPSPPEAIEAESGMAGVYMPLGSSQKTPKMVVMPTKGLSYYFDELPAGKNTMVNQLVSQMTNIFMVRRSQINWTQFAKQFMPQIVVNHFGRPKTPDVVSEARAATADGDAGPLGTTALLQQDLNNYFSDVNIIWRGFQEARKKDEKAEKSLQQRLGDITKDIQNAGEEMNKVSEFLGKYRITSLIEAALECLLFKIGYRGEMPAFIPGIDPFDPTPPRLLLKFPAIELKFPIIKINKEMLAEIEEGLKRAAMSALFGIIEAIADIIRELCLKDDHPDESTRPLQDAIDNFLSPIAPPGGARNCYNDYNLTISEAEMFLNFLANQITDKETCDLVNGYPSNDVLQIIRSVLAYPELSAAAAALPDDDTVREFFICLGSFLDPSYCEGVYNVQPNLTAIDPCEIEDQLAENPAFQEILNLLNEVADLTPDMSCGGGIVPAMADVASYNYAVTTLIDSILQPSQQFFITDLGNYKAIIMKPDPYNEANQARLDEIRVLSGSLNPPRDNPSDTGGGKKFLKDLIPEQVIENFGEDSEFGRLGAKLRALAERPMEQRLADLQASVVYAVAPETRRFYQNIEDNFVTSKLFEPGPNVGDELDSWEASKRYSFLTNIPLPLVAKPAGLYDDYGKSIVYSLDARRGQFDITPNPDRIHIFDDVVGTPNAEIDALLSLPNQLDLFPGLEENASTIAYYRQQEAKEFGSTMTSAAATLFDSSPNLDTYFIRKAYPAVYFSLINMFAYQIGNSELFDAKAMSALSLFPKFCHDGRQADADLFDANQIKREALQEFVDNSCTDRQTELGPVRDAGILALVSAYLQVLVVDLMLKNIFVINEFGADFLTDASEIVNELFSQASTGRDTSAYLISDYARIPSIVRKGAALAVRKLIDRDPVGFNSTGYPISGPSQEIEDLIVNNGLIIPVFQTAGFINPLTGEYTPPENPQTSTPPLETQLKAFDASKVHLDNESMQKVAIRYLFEKRLLGTQNTIKEYFKVEGTNVIENYLLHGIPHVEIPVFDQEFRESAGLPRTAEFDTLTHENDSTVQVRTVRSAMDHPPTTWFEQLGYFSGGSTREERRYEMNSIMNYGGLVAEKYMLVEYNAPAYQEFLTNIEGTLLGSLGDQLAQFGTIMERQEGLVAMSYADVEDPSSTMKYYISFDFFKSAFKILFDAMQLQRGGVFPIPFALRGNTAYQIDRNVFSHNSTNQNANDEAAKTPCQDNYNFGSLNDHDTKNLYIQLSPAGSEWGLGDDGSDPYKLSDYALIRGWVRDIQRGNRPAFLSDVPDDRMWRVRCKYGDDWETIWRERGNPPIRELRSPRSTFANGKFRWNPIPAGGYGSTPGEEDDYLYNWPTPSWVANHGYAYAPEAFGIFKSMAIQGLINKRAQHGPGPHDGSPTGDSLGGVLLGTAAPRHSTDILEDAFQNDLARGETGFGMALFESESFMIVVRLEKNWWNMTNEARTHDDYQQDDVPYSSIYLYLVLKSRDQMDETTNSNFLRASETSSKTFYAPFLDFENSMASGGSADEYRENFEIMMTLFDTYRTQEDLFDGIAEFHANTMDLSSAGSPSGTGSLSPTVEEHLPDSTPPPEFTGLAAIFSSIFPSIEMGMRLSYITPKLETINEMNDIVELFGTSGVQHHENIMKQYKSYYMYGPMGESGKYFANMATNKKASRPITDNLFSQKFQDFVMQNGTVNGFSRYVDFIFNETKPASWIQTSLPGEEPAFTDIPEQPSVKLEVARMLAAQTQQLFGPGEVVDVGKILQYLYITGEIKNYYTLFQNEEIFADTKHSLLLAIQAAFAGDDYTATSACDQSALQAQVQSGISSALTPFANMGQSFINKMLDETPKHLIKGIAEMIEPHVILAKFIKDTTGQVFQGMEQAQSIANMAMGLASGLAAGQELGVGGGVDGACNENPTEEELAQAIPPIPANLPMTLEGVMAAIQAKIDQAFPAVDPLTGGDFPEVLKPQVSVKGLDLLGSLPYTFALPPLTPIGMIYLLLRLGDWPELPDLETDCREEAATWPPNEEE